MDRESKYVSDLVKKGKLFNYPDLDKKPSWKLETGTNGKKKIVKINRGDDPYIKSSVEQDGLRFMPGDLVWLDVGDDCVPVKVIVHRAGKYIVETEEGLKQTVDKDLLLSKIDEI